MLILAAGHNTEHSMHSQCTRTCALTHMSPTNTWNEDRIANVNKLININKTRTSLILLTSLRHTLYRKQSLWLLVPTTTWNSFYEALCRVIAFPIPACLTVHPTGHQVHYWQGVLYDTLTVGFGYSSGEVLEDLMAKPLDLKTACARCKIVRLFTKNIDKI